MNEETVQSAEESGVIEEYLDSPALTISIGVAIVILLFVGSKIRVLIRRSIIRKHPNLNPATIRIFINFIFACFVTPIIFFFVALFSALILFLIAG